QLDMRIISTFQATHRIILWQWTSTVDIVVNVDPRRHQVQVVVEVKEEVQVVVEVKEEVQVVGAVKEEVEVVVEVKEEVQVVVEVKEEVQVVEMNDSIRFTLCSCPSAALHVTVGAKIPITGNRKKSNIL